MLDAVIDFLPSPIDVEAVEGHKMGNEEEAMTRKRARTNRSAPWPSRSCLIPTSASSPTCACTPERCKPEPRSSTAPRTARSGSEKIYRMHANKREEIDATGAGDIVAVMGLKDTTTGDTLCDSNNPVVLESMTFPEPVISVAIEPKTKSDQEKLGTAIQRLAEEDPTFRVSTNEETGQTIIEGMGEFHLEVLVDRMKREFKVEANVGKPQVAYRETLTKLVEKVEYTHKKQTGGSGQFGRVIIAVEPNIEEGGGYLFENKVTGGRIPREYIPSVDAGCQEAMENGVLAGYPMVDVKVTLLDGAYHDVDSSELAFKIAGSMAFKDAANRAKPALLEPMMAVEVTTPEDLMGDVIGDLNLDVVKCKRWRSVPAPASSRHSFRCRRCSATWATFAVAHRAERVTACNSTPTPRSLRPWQRRSSRKLAANSRGSQQQKRTNRNNRSAQRRTAQDKGERTWPRPSSSAPSRTSTSAPSVISTMARRR